jgi:hypothetical protein
MRKIVGLLVGLMLVPISGSAFALGPCPGIEMVPVPFGYGFACVRQPPIPMPLNGERYGELPKPGDAFKFATARERRRTQLEPAR